MLNLGRAKNEFFCLRNFYFIGMDLLVDEELILPYFFIFSYHLYGFDLPSFSFKSITYALSLQRDIIPA